VRSKRLRRPKIDVDEIVAEADSGSRVVPGKVGFTIAAIAFIWSTFQLYIASPLPFILTELTGVNFTFNNVEARNVHLAFALILVSFAYPLYKGAPKNAVPWYDWLLAALGAICCLYLIFVKESLVMRAGLPTVADLTVLRRGHDVPGDWRLPRAGPAHAGRGRCFPHLHLLRQPALDA
jgi:TRAP-type uncharacterized transport system fused permease subunit